MKNLPRLKNTKRIPGADRLHPKTKEKIQRLAARFGVSQNAVKNCILSQYFKVREEVKLGEF